MSEWINESVNRLINRFLLFIDNLHVIKHSIKSCGTNLI